MIQLADLIDRLRTSLWFVPALFAIGAFVAAAATLTIDRDIASENSRFFLFGGTAEAARSILSTIAASMLTFTGLVFTITMLVLQQAATQLSPRVIRTFLRDWQNQAVLGMFVATFLYTLLVLRDVRSVEVGEFVPGLSVWIAFVLLVASVGAFIYYINHMAQAIRATTVLDNIAAETRQAIDKLYPAELGLEPEAVPPLPPPPSGRLVAATSSGILVSVEESGLMELAVEWDAILELIPRPGDFVPEGSPLFRVRDGQRLSPEDVSRLRGKANLGDERSFQQDASFGFRQLVDIALRALSPGTNDPTTAAQAIDRIHDLLRRLANRSFPSAVRLDESGSPRLILPRPDWDDHVRLAVVEIRLASGGQIQVVRRLRGMLEELMVAAEGQRRQILVEQLQALDAAVASDFAGATDRRLAGTATNHGQSADARQPD